MTMAEQIQEQWQLRGSGPENYERFQVPSVFEPLARVFLYRVPLEPGDRVLDVACGTGVVARLAAVAVGPAGQVVGVDLNPGMLAVAKRHTADAGIEWHEGDAGALPCADGTFDAVLCQQGLQFFPDKAGALREMHRVLAPGGTLALCVWRSIEHSPCNAAIAEALTRHVDADAGVQVQAPFALGDADRLRTLIDAAGFREIEIGAEVIVRRMLPAEESIPGHLASTPVGPRIGSLAGNKRDALIREITNALTPFRDAKGLAVPQGTHIAVARK